LFDKNKPTAKRLKCEQGTLRTHFPSDLAVFAIEGSAPEGVVPLTFWQTDFPVNRSAVVVHYPDVPTNLVMPEGLNVKLPAASISENDCTAFGGFPTDEWKLDRTLPFSVKHSCDLLHGSSGSALVDEETQTILGVNWGGIKIQYGETTETVNAATAAVYALAFFNDKLDVLEKPVPQAGSENRSQAALDSEAQAAKAKRRSAIDQVTSSCGVVNIATQPLTHLLTLIMLLTPLLLITRKRS
jgi:hypothetical protein